MHTNNLYRVKSTHKSFLKKRKEILRSDKKLFCKTTACFGFTLAEVLVTLAVIGVVASLTVPTLMGTMEKAQIISSVKKYTSTLNQAVKMYSVENDCYGDLAACGAFAGTSQHEQAWNAIKPYFKLAKDCGVATGEGCFAPGVTYKYLDGNDIHIKDNLAFSKGILADGASFMITDYINNCSFNRSHTNNTPLVNVCGDILIDINGHKGPNQYGKDVFAWNITKSGVVLPYGIPDDSSFADASTGEPDCDPDGVGGLYNPGGGWGCAGYVMTKGNANYLD